MLKRKKKQRQAPEQPGMADGNAVPAEYEQVKRPHSIFSYYLPVILAAMVTTAAFTVATSWLSNRAAGERLARLAHTLAVSVRNQVAGAVHDRVQMLELLARQPSTLQALQQGGDLGRLRRRMADLLPAAIEVVAIPAGWGEEKVLKAVSGSFAAAEMFQSVLREHERPPAQVLPDARGGKRIMLATPVSRGDALLGVLLAAFPLDELKRNLASLQLQEAYLALEQVVAGGRLLLAGTGEVNDRKADGSLKVPGTLWQVRYAAPRTAGIAWPLLAGLVAGGALLVLAVTMVGYRRLARDCKADMGMMVALVDATLKRTGAATPTPHLVESRPALELLARYAQATYTAQKSAKAAAADKGRPPSMEVEEMEASTTRVEDSSPQPELEEQQLPLEIFHPCLVRGLSGSQLDEEVAQAFGLAVGSLVKESGGSRVAVARDNRSSSDAYTSALVAGLLASGCDVTDLGEAPAPLLNYVLCSTDVTSGVMVTGGHNPPEYNGFKVSVAGRPLAEQDYLELRQRILDGRFARGAGRLESRDHSLDYINHVISDIQLVEPMKLVIDGGNGVAGPLAQRLFEALGCEVTPLFCQPDGGFPNHLPDPSDPRNLQALAQEVQAQGAQLGLALDADGDALALVDEQGRQVFADRLLMALASDIIRRNPGADVIYDVASSSQLPEFILANGGRPIMWRAGHAEMQGKLKESHGLLAGELSGHIYIKDRWYGFDDGIYTAARLLELFSLHANSVSGFFETYASGTRATPLFILETPPGRAEQVVRLIAREGSFEDADVIDLDGIRAEFEDAWGLVRASTTRPALVFRFEARDESALAGVQQRFRELLRQAAPELEPPF